MVESTSSHGVQENALITRKSHLFVVIAIQHLYMYNFTTLQNLSNGMPMFVRIVASTDGQKLTIKSINLQHNHDISKVRIIVILAFNN